MNGADVVAELLTTDAAIGAVVPAGRIKLGRLPDGVALPAILLRSVSVTDRQPLKRKGYRRSTERVAVLVRAASYREQATIIKLVRTACDGRTGAFAGVTNVSALLAGLGPDVAGPADSFEQTQDVRVGFDAPL